jgi:hypothetical protein
MTSLGGSNSTTAASSSQQQPAESNDDARPLELRISPTLNGITTRDEQVQALLTRRDGQVQVLLTFYRENAVNKTEPEVVAIIDAWRQKIRYSTLHRDDPAWMKMIAQCSRVKEYDPGDDPAMTSRQWETMCKALAKEFGEPPWRKNRPPGRVRTPEEADHEKRNGKRMVIYAIVISVVSTIFLLAIYIIIRQQGHDARMRGSPGEMNGGYGADGYGYG